MVVFAHEDKKNLSQHVLRRIWVIQEIWEDFFSPLGQRFNTQIHNPGDLQLSTVDSFLELRNVSFTAPLQRCTSESYYSNVTGSSDDHFYEVMGGS